MSQRGILGALQTGSLQTEVEMPEAAVLPDSPVSEGEPEPNPLKRKPSDSDGEVVQRPSKQQRIDRNRYPLKPQFQPRDDLDDSTQKSPLKPMSLGLSVFQQQAQESHSMSSSSNSNNGVANGTVLAFARTATPVESKQPQSSSSEDAKQTTLETFLDDEIQLCNDLKNGLVDEVKFKKQLRDFAVRGLENILFGVSYDYSTWVDKPWEEITTAPRDEEIDLDSYINLFIYLYKINLKTLREGIISCGKSEKDAYNDREKLLLAYRELRTAQLIQFKLNVKKLSDSNSGPAVEPTFDTNASLSNEGDEVTQTSGDQTPPPSQRVLQQPETPDSSDRYVSRTRTRR